MIFFLLNSNECMCVKTIIHIYRNNYNGNVASYLFGNKKKSNNKELFGNIL